MRKALLIAFPTAAAVAGCGGASPGAGASGPPAGQATRHVVLTHVPRGEAQLDLGREAGSLTVSVSLIGLAPDSLHPADIEGGSCARPGRILYTLSPVSANPTGMAADRTSTIPRIAEGRIPATGWYITVRNGPETSPEQQSQAIACGEVENGTNATSVSVPLAAGRPGTPDQAASGTADLSSGGGQLRALVRAHGLEPRSRHAVHLHMGTCEAQFRDVASLGTLAADARGDATETVALPDVGTTPSAGYVVVHRGQSLDSQADFDPILCGNVGG